MFLLEVKQLSCSREEGSHVALRRTRRRILRDVTFSLGEKETLALLGGSGSGKSTLARCLAGLCDPDGGIITFEGLNIFPHTYNRVTTDLSIQMLFQAGGRSLDPRGSVLDALVEAIEASGKGGKAEGQHAEAQRLANEVGLPIDLILRKPGQLTEGQRQRVAIARVLAAKPKLLIVDEPTSALDTITQASVVSLLLRLQGDYGFSILLVTRDIALALATSRQVAVLYDGVIVENNRSNEIRTRPEHPYTRRLLQDLGLVHADRTEVHRSHR